MISHEQLQRIDASNMKDLLAAMPEHVADARSRALEALRNWNAPHHEWTNVLVCGIGGSAIAGDLVKAYLHALTVPIFVVRGYELPAIASERSLIVISSYSGNTEETLSLMTAALKLNATVVALTTGGTVAARAREHGLPIISQRSGMQPRAALAYGVVPLLTLFERVGLIPDQSEELNAAARMLDAVAAREGNDSSHSYQLAEKLVSRAAVIYSADDFLGPIGTRWRGQIQENAKHLAFSSVLPEMNHTEINAWQHPADMLDRMHVVLLRNIQDEHERVQLRFAILKEFLEKQGVQYTEVHAEGDTRLARMFSLIAIGDWTSYWLAILTNTDPTPIPAIDYLKSRLA
jgi:glucose/mannose-6-phosphate isomerase